MVMQAVNDAVLESLGQEGLQYGDLVSIHKEETGRITSIETDVVKANRLQARIGNAIAQRISEAKSYEISIPIGSLSGSELLLGRGPCLKLKMTLEASTVLQLRNQFASAGVNQTHHQVMLDIQTHVLFITPDSYEPTEVNTSICIAETVIVGEVPQAYAGITTGGKLHRNSLGAKKRKLNIFRFAATLSAFSCLPDMLCDRIASSQA